MKTSSLSPLVIPSHRPRFSFRIAWLGATLGLLSAMLGSTVQAQITRIWDGGGADNNWSTPGNWSSDNVPDTTGEAALFTDDPVGQTKLAPNLSGNVTNGQLRFSATAPGYTITSSGAFTNFLYPTNFGGVGIIVTNGAANQTISVAVVYFLTNQTWDIGGTTILTVSGTIEDAPAPDYALTKNGTGTLVFPGDVRYDGPTTNNAGKLVLSFNNTSMLSAFTVNGGILRAATNANALGNNATRNTINLAGGALELANNTGLTFGSTSRLTVVNSNSTIRSDRLTVGAGVTHTLGTLRIGARTLSVAAGAFVNSGTAGITFGTTTLTNNGAVFDVASGANLTMGALTGNFTFTNQGSGQLTLNTAANANRTSARVTLSSGTMKLGSASALGTAAVPLTLNGGTLDLAINGSVNAHNTTVGGNTTIASDRSAVGVGVTHTLGTLAIGAQTLSVTAGANATSGTAGTTFGATTLSGNATFDVVNSGSANAQLTLGAVGESGGARSLTKTGNGTLRLNGAGSYTGSTTLSQGAITLGVANALGNGGFNFAGGTLNANNTTDSTIGTMSLTDNSTLNLSPGGASATLTFAGVSGTANGILTITGWSGSAGGLGTNDKIIFSGGTTPNADFLQHIHFDLGGGNIYPGALGAGGELIPSVTSGPPNQPVSISPADGATDISTSPTLSATVSDSDSDNLTVTFYGRVASSPAGADFTFIAMPDTQYYVSSLNGGLPAMFTNQTQWIVNERVSRNIQYVAQLGDCTQNGDNGGNDAEWRIATNAFYRLENPLTTLLPEGVPYGVAVGNHDQSPIGSSSGTTTFYNQYFGEAHFASKDYYGGHYGANNDNHFDLFSASGLDFIVFYFEYNTGMTTNSAVLAWANSVLQTNQNRRAIIVSHWIINDGFNATFGAQGQAIYTALKGNTNLFLMLSGHVTPPEGQRTDTYQGRTVWSILSDYQDSGSGGNGRLRLYEFSPSNNVIHTKTYSPWVNQFYTNASSQFDVPYQMLVTNPFTVIGTKSGVTSGSIVSLQWTNLAKNTTHDWYVTVSDGSTTVTNSSWSFTTGTNDSVAVPDVVGQAQSVAESNLMAAGLSVGAITTASSATVAVGMVLDQNPAAGASAPPATPVDLVISAGLEQVAFGITGGIEIVPLPPNLNSGQFISQTHIRLMLEGTGIVTAGMPAFLYDVAYHDPSKPIVPGDVTFGNAVTTNASGPGLPSVGSQVYSVLLHFDPNVSGLPFDLNQGIGQSGTITFDRPILGVYVTSQELNATDGIFTPSGVIFSSLSSRDMEFNYDGDQYFISADRLTLTLTMFSHNGGFLDEMRIILPMESPVTVPNVVGLAQAVAEANIVTADLTVGPISNASSATVAAGIVLDQNPAAGASVSPGTAITLIVSTGPSVPNVANLTQAAAMNAIINAGLSVGYISNIPHGILPAGSVISQNPSAGTSAAIGSSVDLIVSLGITLADFVGAPTNGMSPLTVVFTNLSTSATNYSWDFGGGRFSTNTNPVNTYSNAGSYSVSLTVIGPGGTNTLVRANYIVLSNAPPVLLPIADQIVSEETLLTLTASASDPDVNQGLSYHLNPDVPEGAAINNLTGEFAWTPTEAQGPSTNLIEVVVTDSGAPSSSAMRSFKVVVLESNQSPVLSAIEDRAIFEGETLSFTNEASDTDLPANILTYSLEAGAPVTATINAATGVFTWTATSEYLFTTNEITVVVSDNSATTASDSKAFNVVVMAKPRLMGITEVSEGSFELSWQVQPGRTYRFQFLEIFSETNWTALGEDFIPAISSIVIMEDAGTNRQGYYRLLDLSSP